MKIKLQSTDCKIIFNNIHLDKAIIDLHYKDVKFIDAQNLIIISDTNNIFNVYFNDKETYLFLKKQL